MKISTFFDRHKDVNSVYCETVSGSVVSVLTRHEVDMGRFSCWKIKKIEPPPEDGELYTLIVND